MEHFTRESFQQAAFEGFVRLQSLEVSSVPALPGVYVVLRESVTSPAFLDNSCGGRFKSKDPTVSAAILAERWIDDCCALYIGKATNLRGRLRQFRDFGLGKPVGHWGGRYVWQLADANELIVCWRATITDPREEEKSLFASFRQQYGRLPFANINS